MVAPPRKPREPTVAQATEPTSDPADAVYVHLSDQDRDAVLESIDADAQPNDALKSLAGRFKQRHG